MDNTKIITEIENDSNELICKELKLAGKVQPIFDSFGVKIKRDRLATVGLIQNTDVSEYYISEVKNVPLSLADNQKIDNNYTFLKEEWNRYQGNKLGYDGELINVFDNLSYYNVELGSLLYIFDVFNTLPEGVISLVQDS
jgi:hypothetical protein